MFRIFKWRDIEKQMYELQDKLSQWEEHVRWLSPSYPVLADIADRIKNGQREMMASRNGLITKHGDNGISLAELIVLNTELRKAAMEQGGWSDYQLNRGTITPFVFSDEIQYLFNTHYTSVCKQRVPILNIYASSDAMVGIIEATIKQVYGERKLITPRTYDAPIFKVSNINRGLDKTTIEINETFKQPIQHIFYLG